MQALRLITFVRHVRRRVNKKRAASTAIEAATARRNASTYTGKFSTNTSVLLSITSSITVVCSIQRDKRRQSYLAFTCQMTSMQRFLSFNRDPPCHPWKRKQKRPSWLIATNIFNYKALLLLQKRSGSVWCRCDLGTDRSASRTILSRSCCLGLLLLWSQASFCSISGTCTL